MATFWTNSEAVNDTLDGTSFVNAKKSITEGVALLSDPGDILNVVAPVGTPALSTGAANIVTAITGTSYSAFGVKIRGTDSGGNPATAYVQPWDADNGIMFAFRGGAYHIVEGFHVDSGSLTANRANVTLVGYRGDNSNGDGGAPGRIRYCTLDPNDEHFSSGNVLRFLGGKDPDAALWEVTNCLVKSSSEQTNTYKIVPFEDGECTVSYCVFEFIDLYGGNTISLGSADAATTKHSVHHNTFWMNNAGTPSHILSQDAASPAGTEKTIHSNVIAQFGAGDVSWTLGNASNVPWAGGTRDIGYNIFINPNEVTWENAGPYQIPFDPDEDDAAPEAVAFYATDVHDTDADADPFQDKSAAYSWSVGGYTLTLAGDLRMAQYRTSAKDGGIPGAVQDTVPLVPSPPSPPSDPPIWTGDPGVIGPTKPGKLTASGRFQARKNLGIQIDQNARTDPDTPLVATTIVPASYVIAASGTQAISLGTLSPATNLILSADQDITLTVDSAAFLLKKGGCFLLSVGSITTLSVTNLSSVSSVTVNYFASDG